MTRSKYFIIRIGTECEKTEINNIRSDIRKIFISEYGRIFRFMPQELEMDTDFVNIEIVDIYHNYDNSFSVFVNTESSGFIYIDREYLREFLLRIIGSNISIDFSINE